MHATRATLFLMAQNRRSDSFANATSFSAKIFHARQKILRQFTTWAAVVTPCDKMKAPQSESATNSLPLWNIYIYARSRLFRVHAAAASERKVCGTVGYANYFRRDVCVQLELHARRVFIWCLRAGEMNSHLPLPCEYMQTLAKWRGGFIYKMRSRNSSGGESSQLELPLLILANT